MTRLCYNQDKMGKGDGFTIIEVVLFLAISGALLLMAMIGSGEMARHARFSDSVNAFHSNLQRYYEEVTSGVNTREANDACTAGTVDAGTDSCLLLGRVISFEEGTSSGFVRYATGGFNVADTGTIHAQIRNANITVRDSGEQNVDLAWGATFQSASRASGVIASQPLKQVGSTRALINNVAFIRHPNGSEIAQYYFYSTSTTLADVQAGLTTALNALAATSTTTASICIINDADFGSLSSPIAAILLGSGRGSASIDTDFAPSVGVPGICE